LVDYLHKIKPHFGKFQEMKNFIYANYRKYKDLHWVLTSDGFEVNVPLFLLKSAYYHLRSKNIWAHHHARIRGIANIETDGRLLLGVSKFGLNREGRTVLEIEGKLVIHGDVEIGKGCCVLISKSGVCTIRESYITGGTNLIVCHGLEIGRGSAIAWGCEIMDEDFHPIEYEGKVEREREPNIVIGEHVWIGSYARILRGVHIGDNSVIASNSVVTKSFEEKNVLIAGNPAQIIRRGVKWL
jgi:carbonic anhydrase/acetyltransferase-like protein (isoleucine patch superfamily)